MEQWLLLGRLDLLGLLGLLDLLDRPDRLGLLNLLGLLDLLDRLGLLDLLDLLNLPSLLDLLDRLNRPVFAVLIPPADAHVEAKIGIVTRAGSLAARLRRWGQCTLVWGSLRPHLWHRWRRAQVGGLVEAPEVRL